MPTSIFGDISLVAAIIGALVPAPCAHPIDDPNRRRFIASMVKTSSPIDRLKRVVNRAKILGVSDRRLATAGGISIATIIAWKANGPGTFKKVESALPGMEALLEKESLALETKRTRLQREVET